MVRPWGPTQVAGTPTTHLSPQQRKKYDFLQNYMVLAQQLGHGHKLSNFRKLRRKLQHKLRPVIYNP